MINDILDFSKLEAGKLTLKSIDFSVQAVIGGVVSLLGTSASAKGIQLEDSSSDQMPDWLKGDPNRIGRSCSISLGTPLNLPSRAPSASWRHIANCLGRSSKFAWR